jgi:hypothetical protein
MHIPFYTAVNSETFLGSAGSSDESADRSRGVQVRDDCAKPLIIYPYFDLNLVFYGV